MRTKSTRTIGFIFVDVAIRVFGSFVKAAQEVLHGANYSLVLANTGGARGLERELVTVFEQRQVDGLIMTVTDENHPELGDLLSRLQAPVVLLDRELAGAFDMVLTDHARGMYQATRYLLELGHRRIALITASQAIRAGRERLRGFTESHTALGLAVDPALVRSESLSTEYGFQEAYALLTMDAPPTALIAGGNQILTGVLRAVHTLGIEIPRQLSLISCDDTDVTALATPSITVVNRDLLQIGRTAAEMLLYRLRDGRDGGPRRVMLPTHILLRESCAAPMKHGE
jgi:LacI family transcriptional regulator